MTDLIVAVVLLLIIGSAVAYIVRARKSGAKCIGCPHAKSCGRKTDCNCSSAK